MDFDRAAKCLLEIQCCGAGAAGAAHELGCEVESSSQLSANDKVVLGSAIAQLFPRFGTLNEQALNELHDRLMKFEEFARCWIKRRMQGRDRECAD